MNIKRNRIFGLIFSFAVAWIGLVYKSVAHGEIIKVENASNLKAVYLIETPNVETIRVTAVFSAGEVDYNGPQGMSHYLEHLMYWHADKVNKKPVHGRSGNAWVNGIITTYYTTGIAAELDDLFQFSRRLLDPPKLNPTFMSKEKNVVEREYDFRIAENPDRQLQERMNAVLYGDSPVGRSVIGTPATIQSLTIDEAFAFHRKYYVPANLTLLISGKLSEKSVREKVEALFGELEKGEENDQSWRQADKLDPINQVLIQTAKNVESNAYKYSTLSEWKGSGDRLQDYYTRLLVNTLFTSALEGGLAKPLRLDNFYASGISTRTGLLIPGVVRVSIWARPDEGVSLEELGEKITTALSKIGEDGVPLASIERIKKRMLKKAKRLNEEVGYQNRRSTNLLRLGLAPNGTKDHLMRIGVISKLQVDSLIKAIADPYRIVAGHVLKEN